VICRFMKCSSSFCDLSFYEVFEFVLWMMDMMVCGVERTCEVSMSWYFKNLLKVKGLFFFVLIFFCILANTLLTRAWFPTPFLTLVFRRHVAFFLILFNCCALRIKFNLESRSNFYLFKLLLLFVKVFFI